MKQLFSMKNTKFLITVKIKSRKVFCVTCDIKEKINYNLCAYIKSLINNFFFAVWSEIVEIFKQKNFQLKFVANENFSEALEGARMR